MSQIQGQRPCVMQPRVARSATLGNTRNTRSAPERTPTGFRRPAMTLGGSCAGTLSGFHDFRGSHGDGSPRVLRTLGCMTEARWASDSTISRDASPIRKHSFQRRTASVPRSFKTSFFVNSRHLPLGRFPRASGPIWTRMRRRTAMSKASRRRRM